MAQHHVQVRVSRENFFNNIQHLRRLVAPSKLCVVMKANAYGHGLEALAPVAVEAGADMLGICTNPEAETIRRLGLKVPLLRLRMALEAEMEESVRELDIQEQVGSQEAAAYLSEAGVRRGRPVDVHLDIDTGMGRSGFFPEQIETIRQVMGLPGLRVAGVMSHFPTADSSDLAQTSAQIERMELFCNELGLSEEVLVHTHNSAATVRLTGHRRAMVRVGAACYGVRTSREFENPPELKPVMSFRTWIAQIRDVPEGPHRGIRRSLHDGARQQDRSPAGRLRRRLSPVAVQQGHRPDPRPALPGDRARLLERAHDRCHRSERSGTPRRRGRAHRLAGRARKSPSKRWPTNSPAFTPRSI